jgi:hypothetical protein
MLSKDWEDALAEYDAVTSDVISSNNSTFGTNLERWFEALDETPVLARVVRNLETRLNFQEWYESGAETLGNMVGSGELRWPRGERTALRCNLRFFEGLWRASQGSTSST